MRNAQIENPNIRLPVQRVFNLEEAIQLTEGKFKFDDDDEELQDQKFNLAANKEGELNLGRAL